MLRHIVLRMVVVVLAALGVLALVSCEIANEESPVVDITSPEASPLPRGDVAVVTRVIDGDTIEVQMDGALYDVRYIGVNTPERDQPCYDAATAANADMVARQTVQLVQDVSNTDRYGRLLRYVYVGDVFVNAELVREGYAEAGYYPPDTAYHELFTQLEAQADRAGLGCHPTGVFD